MTTRDPIRAPLRISEQNPCYFAAADGRPVYLTGSHTWNNLVDMGPRGAVTAFDWDHYLDFLDAHDHNFVRLWAFDSLATWNPRDEVSTLPWLRTGPGVAADRGPKLDLDRLDNDYFARLRDRVSRAGERGIYVSVMLFECWTADPRNEAPVDHHVFAGQNNVNGIDLLDTSEGGLIAAWMSMQDADALKVQERYVQRVVETVNDLDNVLYEVANEGGASSAAWQEHMIELIRGLEGGMSSQHPIGRTGGMGDANSAIHASAADWIAPDGFGSDHKAQGYRTGHYTYGSGPFDRGDRPILLDTDHIWGVGGDVHWVWASFCRGYNVLYMDPWDDQPAGFFEHPRWPIGAGEDVRREMGEARAMAARLDLATVRPLNAAASSGYCLATPGERYVAYEPSGRTLSLDLPAGDWSVTWHACDSGVTHSPAALHTADAGTWELRSPQPGSPTAVFVERAERSSAASATSTKAGV